MKNLDGTKNKPLKLRISDMPAGTKFSGGIRPARFQYEATGSGYFLEPPGTYEYDGRKDPTAYPCDQTDSRRLDA